MQKDLRQSPLYQETEAFFISQRQPGTGRISDAAEVHVSPDGNHAVFAGVIMDVLDGTPPTRICQTDLETGDTRVLTFGPNTDRLPKFSPDGRQIAFLSDRHTAGDFQLYLFDPIGGVARAAPRVDGWVEYLQWSPDGKRILLGVAGRGADISGAQGAIASGRVAEDLPSWMPAVDTGDESHRWRSAWVYDVGTGSVKQVTRSGGNIWEATWCSGNALAAVISPGPGEGLWYTARLQIIEIESGNGREMYIPQNQLGWPSASPSGSQLAIVEAICSDRWIVAGDLRLIDTVTGKARNVDTQGVDVTYTEWCTEHTLLLAGHRGFESVVGIYDAQTGKFSERWTSTEISTGATYMTVAGTGETGDCVLVGEGFLRAPEIAIIRNGEYHVVRSFDLNYAEQAKVIAGVERLTWKAPDGLEIYGWLLRPHGTGPYPLIMTIHGGPVSHWRPTWLARPKIPAPTLLLLRKGYAVFLPNPRGGGGHGQTYARHVVGDMGGADTYDYLSGLDYLVGRGIADSKRLGVNGSSYGGFMTSWLITQDTRFAAALSRSPITNQVTQHLISNIPHFSKLFLADNYYSPSGKYFQRSPVMQAHKAKTPTLNVCGALDRCTPPEEAVQFHNALLENGVESVLVTYPMEGHGVRKFPSLIDYHTRFIAWFQDHMGPR